MATGCGAAIGDTFGVGPVSRSEIFILAFSGCKVGVVGKLRRVYSIPVGCDGIL